MARGLPVANVFLSYDREDADKAQAIAGALEKAGHEVWWDRHIRGGAEYSEEIEQALDDADAVIVLWSTASVKSAWVRDEAAAGRDSGRLVPVLVESIKPPMGFRQYQSVDLADWSPRRRSAQFDDLLKATQELSGAPRHDPVPAAVKAAPAARPGPDRKRLLAAIGAAALLAIIAFGAWTWNSSRSHPTSVSVAAADGGALSRSLARNLLVKLGTLQGSNPDALQLLDETAPSSGADLKITVGGTTDSGKPRATVTLASSKAGALLWSKDFEQPQGTRADLEEQIAFATARVLGCSVEESSGKNGRLNDRVRRTYLNACATLTEVGWDTRSVIPAFRQVLEAAPKFRPAWADLLFAESDLISLMQSNSENVDALRLQIQKDIRAARAIDPDMAEATLAELTISPDRPITQTIAMADKAKSQDSENPRVLSDRSLYLSHAGRNSEAVYDAERAARLDPLSPAARRGYILALAYSGHIDRARQELERAQQLWPGTQSVRDTEFAIELRYGDFKKVLADAAGEFRALTALYVEARLDPSDAKVKTFLDGMRKSGLNPPAIAWIAQALGEMKRTDDFYEFFGDDRNVRMLRSEAYVLFRPWVAPIRADPRFIGLTQKLGLNNYWRSSGEWPDFCREPGLPYDCKAEAAKYAH